MPGLQLELFPLLPDILDHCHRLVVLLLLGVDLHQLLGNYLKPLQHVFSRLCTHLQVGDVFLLTHRAHVLHLHLSLLVDVRLVAEDDQLHVWNRIFLDLS